MTTSYNQTEILKEFRKHLVSFLDELIEQFPQEGDIVVFRLFVTNQMPIKTYLDKFCLELNNNNFSSRQKIAERDDKYFLDIPISNDTENFFRLPYLRKLWTSPNLDFDDKEVIWKWLDLFVKLADKYQETK